MTNPTSQKRWSPAKVRLSDSAVLAGIVSLAYAACLMAFPRAFPLLLERMFYGGYFFRTLAVLLLVANEVLFVVICKRRDQRPSPFTAAYIGCLTITLVFVFRALLVFADDRAQIASLLLHLGRKGLGAEELLLYTHLGIVSGIFFPYVLVRLTQDYTSRTNSAEPEAKTQVASAGQ